MIKRLLFAFILCLFIAPQAQAAWPETWTNRFVNSMGALSRLAIPSPTAPADVSDHAYCGSPGGCTLTIIAGGAGTYNVMISAVDDDYGTAANYIDSGTLLAAEGVVFDFPAGRYLKLEAVDASDAVGVALLSGN